MKLSVKLEPRQAEGGGPTSLPCIANDSTQDQTRPASPAGSSRLFCGPAGRGRRLLAWQPSQSEAGAIPPMRNLHTLGSNLLQWETSIHWAPNLLQWTLWFYRPFPVAPPPYFPIKANSPCLFTGFAYNPPFLYSRNGNSSGCSQVNLLLSLKKNWLLTQLKLRHIKIDCIPATGGPNTDFPKWMWPHCIHRAHIIRLRLLGTYFGKYFISPSTILINEWYDIYLSFTTYKSTQLMPWSRYK